MKPRTAYDGVVPVHREPRSERHHALDACNTLPGVAQVNIAHPRERFCCDGKCTDNQGRGTCPRDPIPAVKGHVRKPGIAVRFYLWTRGWHPAERVMALILFGVLAAMAFGWLR